MLYKEKYGAETAKAADMYDDNDILRGILEWTLANELIVEDLGAIDRQNIIPIKYDDFIDDPTETVNYINERFCIPRSTTQDNFMNKTRYQKKKRHTIRDSEIYLPIYSETLKKVKASYF